MNLVADSKTKPLPIAVDSEALTLCDREAIHTPGAIQPHGALLALDRADFRIIQAGGDTEGLLGALPQALLGTDARALFSTRQVEKLTGLTNDVGLRSRAVHLFSISGEAGRSVDSDVIGYYSGELLVLEIDPRREPAPVNPLPVLHAMLRGVHQADGMAGCCQAIVDEVRRVIGFDRVMLYRFLSDGSGEVIAEAVEPSSEAFLGLRYPESDIPKQARELYRLNWLRTIPDARYSPAPILSMPAAGSALSLDLSNSNLRSVSPVHRQYLANMGVVASLSMSIIIQGRLWGLIACHHHAPRYLPYSLREACELFAEMVSSQLEGRAAADSFRTEQRSRQIHEELLNRLSRESELAAGLIRFRPNLLDLVSAGGVGLWMDGRFSNIGATPQPSDISAMVDWLNATVEDGVFHTDHLPLIYPPAGSFAGVASGLLALSVSRNPRDYVLWFRPELVRTVNWAGRPDKSIDGSDSQILTPRNSFAMWQQQLRQHASPWLGAEIEAAHRLRLALLEVVLSRIDQMAREREAARLRQEGLTIELNERLAQSERLSLALRKETELRAAVEGDLTQVLRRTVTDQEFERQRISRELHDTLGQSLTMLQLGLQAIGHEVPAGEKVQQRLDSMKSLASSLGRDVNRLATDIRPTTIDDLGIQKAIESLLESWSENTPIKYYLHLSPDEVRLAKPVETALYRVLQEILANVVRHAEAGRVGVVLRVADGEVSMIVEDDGRGFPADYEEHANSPALRLGLLGIRERLAQVAGVLEIESSPGCGTTVFVRIPSDG